MNSNSAVATGAAAISGAMLGGVIVWLCSVIHVEAPPSDVAGTIGAVLLCSGHAVVNWLSVRFPPASPVVIARTIVAPAAPAAPAAPVAEPVAIPAPAAAQ